ncbi:hypothetical protein SDRG_07340 [Saprolegnia diclina VS20]|uniref:MSP domain-containing protein n=1 Tax=Saprolegnia diclina (strain VS20) TaxID=1156394 RepID=T0QK67_SAPDV|nr:hypothetical protein SDRG_07340 [Saprolegnia diclina VS20]EQC35106.1 hypothetical protein SDRG_07340 [Saprolegnia diclina VS20]|eukprot:XP_008611390.1 hypothetical protein SDRG_07340 [Saprolegnia diclina VS20]
MAKGCVSWKRSFCRRAMADEAVLNRVEQARVYGIDCGDEILFGAGAWAPGGEHTKKLVVKNVSNKTIKFKYDLPRTKYFSMDFPLLITLSPGTSRVLDIAFRPVQYEEYDDCIRFTVHIIDGGVKATNGTFRLPVKARIAMLRVELPSGLDFGFCPTAETTDVVFQLKSTGQIDASFRWSLPDAGEHGRPFKITPSSGEIKAGQVLDVTARFAPRTASVYVVTALFAAHELGETHQHQETTLKISGIGKFAYFATSETELDFGDMLVNGPSTHKSPTEREFVLRNRSLVRASFHIFPIETDHEPTFFFSPLKGTIPPESALPIRVKYTPLSPGTFTCDNFKIVTPGGHAAHIVCKGKAIGPLVSLWKKNRASNLVSGHSVNFRDVRVGETATRVLYLRNEAAIPVRFHLVSAANGIFGVSKVAGEIPPLLEASVLLTFAPLSPGNYYRRLFCLLQNQATMFVDVLGTGYDAEIRPSPFEQGHVDAYRLRCEHNLGHLSPDGLEALWGDKGDELFLQGALARQREAASRRETTRLLTRSGDMLLADVDVCHEFFIQPDDRHGAIFASDALLDFGVGFDIKKTLLVTNQTRGKVTCTWRIAEAPTAVESSNFTIFPTTCDIGPGASAEFRVGFHPKQSNTYFFAELESSVYFKSNRTFRLVNPETFTPPWCIVVQATGHTFASTDSQFLSRVTYATAKDGLCAFPPAFIGDSVFQTVVLMNSSDTPAVFAITQDPSRVFRAKPSCGLIPPNGFHLVQIRFSPTKSRRYSHMLKTTVNHSTSVALELTGTGCFPHLICQELDGGPAIDKLFIKPTSIGLSSTRLFRVKNGCRIPLVFRWSLPPSVQDVFQLSPLVHRLLGNEASVIACVFAPSLIKQYNQRLTLHVKSISMARGEPPSSHLPILQDVSIKVTGVGTTGAVAFEPAELTLPTVLVNSDATGPFQLVNGSDCDLQFELRVTVLDSSKLMARPHLDKKLAATYVSFSKPSGVIGARSTQQVGIAFRGDLAGSYDYGIQCAIATLDAVVLPSHHGDDDSVNCVEMQVHASASFPTLFFEDIRLAQTPTAVAWAQFQCEEINAFMAAPLTNDELKLNSESSPDLSLLKVFPLRFTPNVIGTHTEDVVIQLRNPGSLVVDFRIFYPNESDIEIEPWADTSEPTTDELRQNIIIDSKLFTVAPRKGVLQPHESLLLRLSYAYASMQYDGVHDLQLLVSVSQGKKMMLSLHGRTLPKASPLLFLPRTNWVLSPVMLSESGRKEHLHARPALQQFQVFNRGDAPFLLDIDDADLARINATSHNFPILECLTQRVSVPPNASVFLDLEFCPLEQLTYHGTLLLSVEGLESGYQEQFKLPITARGYDASKTSFAMTRDSIVRGGPPTVQKAPPESRAALSCDVLDLGHVCVHTEHTRLVVLTNLSATATLSFAWDANHHLVHANRVRFFPMQGRLSPLEHCMVRVTVAPAADLLVIDHDIACWVRLLHDAAASSTLESAKTTREAKPSDTRPSVLTRTTISSRAHFSRDEPATTEDYTPPLALALPKLKPKPAPASGMRSPKGPRRKPSPTRGNSSRKARFGDGSDAAESDETLRGSKVLQPLYIHVFAHVLPLETFRRQLTREDFERRPLAIPSGETRRADDLEALRTAWRVTKDPAAMSESRHVIEGVLSHLVTDLFGTGTIDQAVDELLPTEPETPYFVQFGQPACDKRRARLGRLLVEDDFRRIASLVLENTMLNVVQEIGLGEFDLACLPKQLVFLPDEET